MMITWRCVYRIHRMLEPSGAAVAHDASVEITRWW